MTDTELSADILVRLRPETVERIRTAAAGDGLTPNIFVQAAIENFLGFFEYGRAHPIKEGHYRWLVPVSRPIPPFDSASDWRSAITNAWWLMRAAGACLRPKPPEPPSWYG